MTLARIAPTPQRLKAVLRIPETQAGGVVIGQLAMIGTSIGVVPGRTNPNGLVAVLVPNGARPYPGSDFISSLAA